MASGTKDSSDNEDVTLIDLSEEFDTIIAVSYTHLTLPTKRIV